MKQANKFWRQLLFREFLVQGRSILPEMRLRLTSQQFLSRSAFFPLNIRKMSQNRVSQTVASDPNWNAQSWSPMTPAHSNRAKNQLATSAHHGSTKRTTILAYQLFICGSNIHCFWRLGKRIFQDATCGIELKSSRLPIARYLAKGTSPKGMRKKLYLIFKWQTLGASERAPRTVDTGTLGKAVPPCPLRSLVAQNTMRMRSLYHLKLTIESECNVWV